MQSTLFRRAAVALTTLAVSGAAVADDWTQLSKVNLRPGVTEMSQKVYDLHMLILWVVTLIGLLVFGLIMWSVVQHRRSKRPEPAKFHENIGLEILWTVIPFVILIVMAWPATRVLIELEDTSASELTVKVTGYRWYWHYEYLTYEDDLDVGVGFFSRLSTPREVYERPILGGGLFPHGTAADRVGEDFIPLDPTPGSDTFNYLMEVDKPLVIPAGQRVRFLITSDDVIHSFWVPDFGYKKDAIPGFINESWTYVPEEETGIYRGFCAELCGRDHAFMPIEVHVKSREDFNVWLEEQKELAAAGPAMDPFADLAEAMEVGADVYNRACVVCHGAQGQGGVGPTFQGTDLTVNPDRIGENIDILVNGRGAMPSFRAQLSPREIAAVITYQRNAFGNETGDLIQPDDIQQ